jgi:hypothetical protein
MHRTFISADIPQSGFLPCPNLVNPFQFHSNKFRIPRETKSKSLLTGKTQFPIRSADPLPDSVENFAIAKSGYRSSTIFQNMGYIDGSTYTLELLKHAAWNRVGPTCKNISRFFASPFRMNCLLSRLSSSRKAKNGQSEDRRVLHGYFGRVVVLHLRRLNYS